MKWLLVLLALSLLLVGCDDFKAAEKPSDMGLCAADVMVCPDGSFTHRDPANDCDFVPCSDEGFGDPANEWGEGELE